MLLLSLSNLLHTSIKRTSALKTSFLIEVMCVLTTVYLITESEVVTGKSQTKALQYRPSNSKVNPASLRFSHNDFKQSMLLSCLLYG